MSVPAERRYDVAELVERAKALGVTVSPESMFRIWDEYSESFAAGWLIAPDNDDEFLSILKVYAEGYSIL